MLGKLDTTLGAPYVQVIEPSIPDSNKQIVSMGMEDWYPMTSEELELGRDLQTALLSVTTVENPAEALLALEYLSRACVAVLTHRDSPLAEVARRVTPNTAVVVARWAGVDPGDPDPSALLGLTEDLVRIGQDTADARVELAQLLPDPTGSWNAGTRVA